MYCLKKKERAIHTLSLSPGSKHDRLTVTLSIAFSKICSWSIFSTLDRTRSKNRNGVQKSKHAQSDTYVHANLDGIGLLFDQMAFGFGNISILLKFRYTPSMAWPAPVTTQLPRIPTTRCTCQKIMSKRIELTDCSTTPQYTSSIVGERARHHQQVYDRAIISSDDIPMF